MKIMAGFPNVYCKISGMVTENDWKKWKNDDFKPYLDVIFEAFGEDRLMVGSDWPVCKLAAEYEQVMGIVENCFETFPIRTKEKIFGLNCLDFYGIK